MENVTDHDAFEQIERYLLSALVENPTTLEEIKKIVTDFDGEIVKTEELGERKLAFPINKKSELHLVSIFFMNKPEVIPGLEKQLRSEDKIARFLLTRWTSDPNAEARGGRNRVKTEVVEDVEQNVKEANV